MTEQNVQAQLTQQSYTHIHDLEFDHGIWTARAKSGNGARVKLRVDPATGKAYPDEQVSRLSERDVQAPLSSIGCSRVHDVDFKNGMWTAKAQNPAGKWMRQQVDGQSGRVIGSD